MPKKSYTKATQRKKVKQELEDSSPIVVRFYRETCPACQASKPAWDQFDMPGYRVIAVEEAAIPPEILQTIRAFPTYAKHDQNGSGHTVGAITDPSLISKRLNI